MILAALIALSGSTPTCCEGMALLTKDPAFRALHETPLQADFTPKYGHMQQLNGANDFVVLPAKDNHSVILLFHEWWGLNNQIKMTAEKLHEETGDGVVAMDLYGGKVANSADEAGQLVRAVDQAATRALIKGTIDAILRQNALSTPISKLGTLGYCFGGGWSLQTALSNPDDVQACVMYYGYPELDANRLSALHAPLLGFFGKQDKGITPELVGKFDQALKDGGKEHSIYSYDAPHAFANPSNPHFNKEATEDSWKKTIDFYKKYL